MPRKPATAKATATEVVKSTAYSAKRKHIPPAGMEADGQIAESARLRYEYNPHDPPVLRFSSDPAKADQLPELLTVARQRPLSEEEARLLAEALRRHEPWLEWSGKREKPWFEVDPVALHIHERVSTQAILRMLAREDIQPSLFADPQLEYNQAVQFYQHDVDWANRMILGDSLQVMASLARREDLAGKVQMIYLDPPYGISFKSNFQPSLGQRDVKDKEQDLTREPEMVRAYRDTWTLGVHSYLTYLRDRLAMAKELLADTGSIFVQMSDENLHRVRSVMDEVFGAGNVLNLITVKKKSSTSMTASVADYLLWYAKDRSKVKLIDVFGDIGEPEDADKFRRMELVSGERRSAALCSAEEVTQRRQFYLRDDYPVVSQDEGPRTKIIVVQGKPVNPGKNRHWTYDPDSDMRRLEMAGRLRAGDESAFGVVYWSDIPAGSISNVWSDLHGEADPIYVVQTNWRVIERCMLMTTDPGDLVLDPTCGSGTTAYVAEQWGRRWITIDTSRVALALARQRLMTAKFPYFTLRPLTAEDTARNPYGCWLKNGDNRPKTFQCKTVPHITLKSIARNTSLDPIFARHEPILAAKLAALNVPLASVKPALRQALAHKLAEKQKAEGKKAVTDADRRRWLLPETEWKEWEVPFDTDPDWPKPLRDALTAYRAAWRAKMDAVNACIAANAEMEELVDKREEDKSVVRVTGPFTMEGVIAVEDGPDSPISGVPAEELEGFEDNGSVQPANHGQDARVTLDAGATLEPKNAEAHLDKILRLLRASGVDFPGNRNAKFARLEPLAGAALLHAHGEWTGDAESATRRVAVSVGPEVGNLTAYQVEDAVRAANRSGYDDLVFAAFGFDAMAQAAIEASSHKNLRMHMALIRPDVAMGDLLKTQPGSQLFTVFSAPRVKGPEKQKDGQYLLEVEGMDVYDPVTNTLYPTNRERIAAWFLDSNYDGRTFCICQAFFPDKTKWAKLARALGDTGAVAEDAFAALSGLTSLPFPRPGNLKPGKRWRVAVKVIDPRGNEGLRVIEIDRVVYA